MERHAERRAALGVELGYSGQHARVRRAKGPARELNCACGEMARHWAWIHGTDRNDPSNYSAMCYKCHARYDDWIGKQKDTLGPQGRSELAKKAWITKKGKDG